MSMSGHSGGSTMKLYRYDEFNRLIKYNTDGTEAKYTYGVDNLRATKTVNGTTTSYVWNGQNLASETKTTYERQLALTAGCLFCAQII